MENQNIPAAPTVSPENKNLMLAVAAVAIVVMFLAVGWLYTGLEEVPPDVFLQQDTADDAMLQQEIDAVDLGDLDAEFNAIDNDMNGL